MQVLDWFILNFMQKNNNTTVSANVRSNDSEFKVTINDAGWIGLNSC